MSNSQFPSHYELRLAILKMLELTPEGMTVNEIDKQLIIDLGISEVLAAQIHEGKRTEIAYRSAWARSQLKKRGLIEKDEFGFFVLSKFC